MFRGIDMIGGPAKYSTAASRPGLSDTDIFYQSII